MMKHRFFNKTTQSLAVALNTGSTGFVASKGVLEIPANEISADLRSKVKKGFLVHIPPPIAEAVTVPVPVVVPANRIELDVPEKFEVPEPIQQLTYGHEVNSDYDDSNLDAWLDEIT